MKLRNLKTKRKLKKDNEDLRLAVRHLEAELRDAKTDLALEQAATSGYKHEVRQLQRYINALLDDKPGIQCVVVEDV